VFIRKKRYEDTGIAIGIFLLLLSTITYVYIIPQQVVNQAMLPEDYIWYDEGTITYWERNNVFSQDRYEIRIPNFLQKRLTNREPIEENYTGTEVIHAVSYDPDHNHMMIHDVIYDQNGDVVTVINDQEKVSEWYEINPKLSSMMYVNVDAGYMGIPGNAGENTSFTVGWVESNGEQKGNENVALVRTMHKINEGLLEGVLVSVWQSDVYNTKITWHEDTYICDETLRLTVHKKTGYVIHVYRHLVLSAHLSQFIKLYYPDSLRSRLLSNYLKLNDPIGEAAELTYQTTDESQARHLADLREIDAQLTYLPLLLCVPMFIIGLLLLWRYSGRSYYWKRYKHYDSTFLSSPQTLPRRRNLRLLGVLLLASTIILSSVGYALLSGIGLPSIDTHMAPSSTDGMITSPDEQPTPPGNERGIDSGRHVLESKDEGMHRLSKREWWYYNVIFDAPYSDLHNCSMIVSFNKMAFNDIRLLRRDNLFIILYEPDGTSTNFGVLNQPRRTFTAGSPGVDLQFDESWAQGQYPSWQVHAANSEQGFVADLNFTAEFLPVWVMGRSSNLPLAKYFSGDYYIPRCAVEGTILWKNMTYEVAGTGYHDHVWEGAVPRMVTKGWDWVNMHFDNGWEMYLSKFNFRTLRDRYAGALIISPNNRNLVEFNKFTIDNLETETAQELSSLVYPTKIRVTAQEDGMTLKLDITIQNVCELVWRRARTGMFEGPCTATGTFSWDGHTVALSGSGMSEITRVKYLFGLRQPWER